MGMKRMQTTKVTISCLGIGTVLGQKIFTRLVISIVLSLKLTNSKIKLYHKAPINQRALTKRSSVMFNEVESCMAVRTEEAAYTAVTLQTNVDNTSSACATTSIPMVSFAEFIAPSQLKTKIFDYSGKPKSAYSSSFATYIYFFSSCRDVLHYCLLSLDAVVRFHYFRLLAPFRTPH
jgi:hypothetical protein